MQRFVKKHVQASEQAVKVEAEKGVDECKNIEKKATPVDGSTPSSPVPTDVVGDNEVVAPGASVAAAPSPVPTSAPPSLSPAKKKKGSTCSSFDLSTLRGTLSEKSLAQQLTATLQTMARQGCISVQQIPVRNEKPIPL
eukprot:4961759-Amphidinium_carterae.2